MEAVVTEDEFDQRLSWHLSVPCCRILSGLKRHLSFISFGEKWLLCFHLRCEPNSLHKVLWSRIKGRLTRV